MKIILRTLFPVLCFLSANSWAEEPLICEPPQKDNEVRVRRLDYPDSYMIVILAPPNTISMHYSPDGKLLKSVTIETNVAPDQSKDPRKSVLIDLEGNKVTGFMTSDSDQMKSIQNFHTTNGRVLARIVTDQDSKSESYLNDTHFDSENNVISRTQFWNLYESPKRWISLLGPHKES